MTSFRIGAVVIVAALNVVGLPQSAAAGSEREYAPHVRAFDEKSRHVLEAAAACSPTVARMLTDLQASDLIVVIESAPLQRKTNGETRIVAAAGGSRYVRIRLHAASTMQGLMWVLGHELHHATEIAGATEVRDTATQRAFYLRTGREGSSGGRYETDAAIDVGRVVAREVAGCGVR